MGLELLCGQMYINHYFGIINAGSPGEVVDQYILPPHFYNNIGLGLNPKVVQNDIIIGDILSFKIENKSVFFIVKFHYDMPISTVWCKIYFNTLFSSQVNSSFLLDQVILDKVEIIEPIELNKEII